MARKSGVEIKTTIYNTFRGADFSTDPSLVERCRSPLCTNIVADAGGMPEKRVGWRVLHALPAPVYGLFTGTFQGAAVRLVHAGKKLYRWDDTAAVPVELLGGLHAGRSRGVNLCGKLWIVTGGEFIVFDGVTAQRVTDAAPYIPTVTITRESGGGGVKHEDVNLLTPRRRDSFQTNGTATAFTLSAQNIDAAAVKAWVWDEEKTEGTDFTVDRAAGVVSFTAAPGARAAVAADGLVIEYGKTVADYAGRINRCTIITTYGVGSSDRVVLSGNPDYPNQDWISELNDPTYFRDLSYATVGTEATAILGYCRVGAYQAIVKADNGQDSTVFLRSAALSEAGEAIFTLQPALAGVGGLAPGSFGVLLDDALFLSATGVRAISISDMTGNRITQDRSYYLNARLTEETGLAGAEAVVWLGMYLLAVGSHVYVLDARQRKTYRSASLGDFVYEGYYWENVPAACWLCCAGAREELYFGTADGRICKFNTDIDSVTRFADDTAPVRAVWATRYDDDGTPGLLKTLLKPGCCVTIKPYARSSGTVYFRTDRSDGLEQRVARESVDIFDWGDIDFERFTFSGDGSPREVFFNRKIKNYKRLQIIVRNEEINEGFGVYQITKNYVIGNFSKARS